MEADSSSETQDITENKGIKTDSQDDSLNRSTVDNVPFEFVDDTDDWAYAEGYVRRSDYIEFDDERHMDHVTSLFRAHEAKLVEEPEPHFVDITPDKGVTKRIHKEGEGSETPGHNDRVIVNYTGWILSGTKCFKFDSNEGKEPLEFVLGKGTVISAWELGVPTMKKGESALFVVQPEYAYGPAGNPPTIPPMATLLFEIKIRDWKLEDLSVNKDKGILRKVITKGDGTTTANEGSFVKVHMTGFYNNKIFEDREIEFIIGEGSAHDVLEAIETALVKFKKSEKSKLFIKSKYAFGPEGRREYNIPPDADVEYDVTVLSFEKAKDIWDMNTDDKWESSVEAKEKGTAFFKAGNIKAAVKQFKRIVKYLENEPGVAQEELERRQRLLLSGYLNVALCHLKLNCNLKAVKICDKALEIDPCNEKALFRRGQGRLALHDYDQALENFEKVVAIYPENKAAQNHILICQNKIELHKMRERNTYGNMFKKFADEDEELRKQQQYQTETGVWGGQEHGSNMSHHSLSDEDSIVQMLNKQNLCMNERHAFEN